jgi:LysR family glycine cleavage system transcriptional activator
MKKCPLQRPADLERHTLLHAATLREAWPRWLAAAHVPDLKPARDQVFEHFYFAIQAALEGLGVMMGPRCTRDCRVSEPVTARDARLFRPS